MALVPINEKQKFWAVVAGCGVLVLSLGQAAVADLSARVRRNANELKVAEAQLRKVLLIEKAGSQITAEHALYASYLAVDGLPPRQVLEELLREIERIARDASVSVVNLTPQSIPESGSGAREYRADLRLECQGADRLLSFLNGVQASKFLIKIDKFNLSVKDEQGVSLKAEISLSLATGPV